MEAYHWWLIVAFVLTICEIFTSGFFVFCFAVGCIVAAIVAVFGMGVNAQIFTLIAVTIACFFLVRPFMLKLMSRKGGEVATNADAVLGRTASVTEEINYPKGTGRVQIDGDDWKAVSAEKNIIAIGEKVVVTNRDSIVLTVKKIEA